jgi:predicted lipoprotein
LSRIQYQQFASQRAWASEEFATGLYTREQVLRKVTQIGLRTKKGKLLSAQTFSQTLKKPVHAGRIVVPEWNIDVPGKFHVW